jgi:hypothetical protein
MLAELSINTREREETYSKDKVGVYSAGFRQSMVDLEAEGSLTLGLER